MKTYEILLEEICTGCALVQVEADSQAEAQKKAMEMAKDIEFNLDVHYDHKIIFTFED